MPLLKATESKLWILYKKKELDENKQFIFLNQQEAPNKKIVAVKFF